MSTSYRTIGPEALLDLVAQTIRDDLLPGLPPDKRYLGAMLTNAVEIARRGLDDQYDAAQWALLDTIYDDGEGSLRQLARDIRKGAVSKTTHPDLADRFMRLVTAELAVVNPRFLATRGVKS
jgi:hypothetical protein